MQCKYTGVREVKWLSPSEINMYCAPFDIIKLSATSILLIHTPYRDSFATSTYLRSISYLSMKGHYLYCISQFYTNNRRWDNTPWQREPSRKVSDIYILHLSDLQAQST